MPLGGSLALTAAGRRQGVQLAQAEVPFAQHAGELGHGQVGDLFEAIARLLRGERAVLFHQAPGEPQLPDRQADDDGQEERQAPAHRQQPVGQRAHSGISIRPRSSGVDQGFVRIMSGEFTGILVM